MRALCVLSVMALAAIFPSGCGQGARNASSEAKTTSPSTVEQTTPREMEDGQVLTGTAGKDVIRAGDGDDVVRGMGGDDKIHGGEGRDRLYGGPGNDVIDAQDGTAGRDEISCGPGRDEVLMDAEDGEKPRGCEIEGLGIS